MSTTTNVDMPMFDLGDWIAEQRHQMDGNEAVWLDVLADFDATEAWRDDGQLSCVDWLMWRTKMARSTCFEKLQIAHQLRRRPLVAQVLTDDASYLDPVMAGNGVPEISDGWYM